ncbi:MAG: universal stress protein [Thermoproteota archaeon]
MFEKILVPLDGSKHSLNALQTAIQIAKKFDGKITLIHVYSVNVSWATRPPATYSNLTMNSYVPQMAQDDVSKVEEASQKAAANILEDGRDQVEGEEVEVETLLKEGHAVKEITNAARDGEFDLIVIGSRGLSRMKEILLGSVSVGVIRNASCPVLVSK